MEGCHGHQTQVRTAVRPLTARERVGVQVRSFSMNGLLICRSAHCAVHAFQVRLLPYRPSGHHEGRPDTQVRGPECPQGRIWSVN